MKTSKLPRPLIFSGARGRLASALAARFEAEGADVVRVSRTGGGGFLSYEDLWNSNLLRSGGAFLHAAWSTVPPTAEAHPETAWTQDLPLLARLLGELARVPDGNAPRLVFFSSGGAVYGECESPAVESTPLAPVGWYGRGKAAAEGLIADFAGAGLIQPCVLRISNPYGFPYVPEKPQGVVGAALRAMETGGALPLWGATSLKDFLHLDDLKEALAMVLERGLTGIFNVCAGCSYTVLEVLELLERITGKRIARTDLPPARWDVHSSLLDGKALTSATGWTPKLTLEKGLERLLSGSFKASA